MTEAEEIKFNKKKDKDFLDVAKPIFKNNGKSTEEEFEKLDELYNGTSFQKKLRPEEYKAYLETLFKTKS